LIHALHMVQGTMAGAAGAGQTVLTIIKRHSFRNEMGQPIEAAEDLEEIETIGIGERSNGPTENDLRRENALPLRGAHSIGGGR
jgi:hypothetical protein